MVLSCNELAQKINELPRPIVLTSGGFDPMHIGHLRCIQESALLGKTLIVVVNDNGFLHRKKGYKFMDIADRMEIIDGLRGVDFVVSYDDGSQFISGAIEQLRPDIFAKGGDRAKPEDIPEWDTCQAVGCKVVFDVGGGKIRSSSELVGTFRDNESK
jgi:cytidyltransferase-like protein